MHFCMAITPNMGKFHLQTEVSEFAFNLLEEPVCVFGAISNNDVSVGKNRNKVWKLKSTS
jgi:hypothetical protein